MLLLSLQSLMSQREAFQKVGMLASTFVSLVSFLLSNKVWEQLDNAVSVSVVELPLLMQGCKVGERNTLLEEVVEKSLASANIIVVRVFSIFNLQDDLSNIYGSQS